MFKLVSSVVISDIGDFPLCLPLPDEINCGGYMLPLPNMKTMYSYSPIDILIAGLEAQRLKVMVNNLPNFFDSHRLMFSDSLVTLALSDEGQLSCLTISAIKSLIISDKNFGLLKVMRRNAPLTFKWMDI